MIVIKGTLKIANRIKKRFRAKIHETFLFFGQTSPRQHLLKIFLPFNFDYP